MHQQLLEDGYKVSLNTVARYRQELGLQAVLSYKISNTMDTQLVMGVLNEALEKYPHPEIFNTDRVVNTPVKYTLKGLKN